jgi:hypothetical protein
MKVSHLQSIDRRLTARVSTAARTLQPRGPPESAKTCREGLFASTNARTLPPPPLPRQPPASSTPVPQTNPAMLILRVAQQGPPWVNSPVGAARAVKRIWIRRFGSVVNA